MNTVSKLFALTGGVLSVGTAVVFWSSQAVHGLVIPIAIGLGVFGAIAATLAVVSSMQGRRIHAITVCAAGLAACGFVGLMSIGPLAFIAAFLLVVSVVANGPWGWRRLIAGSAVFFVSSLAVFSVLFVAATRIGVRKVAVPKDSSVVQAFEIIDYADAFQIDLAGHFEGDIDDVARAVAESMKPSWLNGESQEREVQTDLQPGSSAGHWPVYLRSDDEVILGLNRSFIDLRFSVLLRDKNGRLSVTATTVARYNNWIGRIYFLPVRYGHQIVIADTLRKTKVALDARSTGAGTY